MFLAVVLMPPIAFAEDIDATLLDAECREELGLTGIELQPGPQKGRYRRCMRLKTADWKRHGRVLRKTEADTSEHETIVEQELQKQEAHFGEESISVDEKRQEFQRLCREQLGIGATEEVLPGLRLGMLEQCIERKTSEASRAANIRRRRISVQRRTDRLGDKVRRINVEKLNEKLEKIDDAARNRLRNQQKANPRQIKAIRESYRIRSYFSTPRIDSKADKRRRAETCRMVTPKEWAGCMKEALGGK